MWLETVNKGAMLKYLWISALVIAADQITKWIANTQLEYQRAVEVFPYFEWFLSYNTGAAFSFLADAGGWQRWFLTILAIVISVVLVIWMHRLPREDKLTAVALALILGGAVGNVIDRILYGHVIDFIQVWLGSYPWPAFNIADSAIFVGAAALIISGMIMPHQEVRTEK